MNIFYLDKNPAKAAEYHCDKHVVKMILESSQMLCTAHRILSSEEFCDNRGLYKLAYQNHPSTVWARENYVQYRWLYNLYEALLTEYTKRYKKSHASGRLREALELSPIEINTGPFKEPPQCMPDEYKVKGNSLIAYRKYYKGVKSYFAKWAYSDTPWWWEKPNEVIL